MRKILIAGLLISISGGAWAQVPRCAGDRLVWVNTSSGAYHYQGDKYFGKTKHGKYECEKTAMRQGARPAHNGP